MQLRGVAVNTECALPGEDMGIDDVDQRPVKIEDQRPHVPEDTANDALSTPEAADPVENNVDGRRRRQRQADLEVADPLPRPRGEPVRDRAGV